MYTVSDTCDSPVFGPASLAEAISIKVRYPACANTLVTPAIYANPSNSISPTEASTQPMVMITIDTTVSYKNVNPRNLNLFTVLYTCWLVANHK
jgi:hypothetical protein